MLLHIDPASPLGLADLALHLAPVWTPVLSFGALLWARWFDSHSGAAMPCYTERVVTLAFQAADATLLTKALVAAGASAHVGGDLTNLARRIVQTGELRLAGMTEGQAVEFAAKVKREYAREVVQFAAKRFGFNVQTDKRNQQHLNLVPRGGF
jgi:hypothetical protein